MYYFNTFWLLFLIYGALPITLSTIWYKESNNKLIITSQQCGCPCPQARLVKGNLKIPNQILYKYPDISRHELTLTGNSPLKEFSFDLYSSEIIIKGSITGIDTNSCMEYECNIIPKFLVKSWTLKNYVPKHYNWNLFFFLSYLILVPLGLIINLTYLGKIIYKKVKN